jgi:hypothetical protein
LPVSRAGRTEYDSLHSGGAWFPAAASERIEAESFYGAA